MRTLLYQQGNIEIQWEQNDHWLTVNWVGLQTASEIRRDCEQLLRMLVAKNCNSILNDTTNAAGIWAATGDWLANDWFPRMRVSGLQHFAWVYPADRLDQIPVGAITAAAGPGVGRVFTDIAEATQWLRVQRHRSKARTQRIILPPGLG